MKKLFVLAAAVLGLAGGLMAQSVDKKNVPVAVVAAFEAKYPHAGTAKWEGSAAGYVAAFKQDGKKHLASFTPAGIWERTESVVKWTRDLPESVKQGWAKSGHYDWTVHNMKQIHTPQQQLYVLAVNNSNLLTYDKHQVFGESKVLYFDAGGELVKKEG